MFSETTGKSDVGLPDGVIGAGRRLLKNTIESRRKVANHSFRQLRLPVHVLFEHLLISRCKLRENVRGPTGKSAKLRGPELGGSEEAGG